ncbi:lipoprotein signal peptidase [Bordetella pertussis]|nr:lipoprotein signal peptidase [Bordetella pertussis]CPJ28542.1 lipoprotein signal peptidase [Bordetella pertussis]CPK56034.1 lipoprotein signal peptidase [Bordetella pertussis]CPO28009.1 lipoprotein signal peptidase [Bordetella pertussis]
MGASIVIVWLLRRTAGQPRFSLALTLIMGGALGNVIDRVAYGHVVDFLLFYWRDWHYPAFNLADVAITCGAVLLVVDELLRARKRPTAQD